MFCDQSLALIARLDRCDFEYHVWDTLGYAELHLGNLARAVDHFEIRARSVPGLRRPLRRAQILTHVGDAHHAAGELSQARRVWQEALALYDTAHHPGAGKVAAKLAWLDG